MKYLHQITCTKDRNSDTFIDFKEIEGNEGAIYSINV